MFFRPVRSPRSPRLTIPGEEQSVESLKTLLHEIKHLNLSERVKVGKPMASGGYAEVHEGTFDVLGLQGACYPMKVAVKCFRVFVHEEAGKDLAKSIAREIRVWANLVHVNVLPFLGFNIAEGRPSLISPWMDKGNLKRYLVDRPNMDIVELAKGIADGLAYLHRSGVIHADLRCDNILVHADERPMLTDFGISRILIESKTFTGTNSLKGNVRWMAAELLDWRLHGAQPEHQFHTKATDVWAFGMVLYELISRNVPYFNLTHEPVVMMAIIHGERPTDLNGMQWDENVEFLWRICERCWFVNPKERPQISELLEELRRTVMPLGVTPLKKFTAHQDWIMSISFSPDGRHLATASADNTVRIWADVLVQAGAPERPTKELVHPDWVYSIAWCPCGRYILTGSQDKQTRMWDVESGAIVLQPPAVHTAGIRTVIFSPDETVYASGGADDTIFVMNSRTGAVVLGPLTGSRRSGWITAIAFSPNGQTIVSCSSERTICVWDITPEGGGIAIHELHNAHSDWISSISFHPSGEFFVTGSKDRTIRIWAFRAAKKLLPDVAGSNGNSLSQVLSSNGFHVHRNEVKSVQFSPCGNIILTASSDNSMRLVDATNGFFLTKEIVGHKEAVWSAKFSPDAQFIASASQDGQVILWRITRS